MDTAVTLYTGGQSPVFDFSIFDVPVSSFILVFFLLFRLLPPLDRLHSHLDQSILGFAFGEIANALDGLLGIVLRQCPCLFDAVGFKN